MKKIFSLPLAAALALSFAACSNEDVPSSESDGTGMYVQMTFRMATSSDVTRAEYSATESSGQYVQGKASEYKVNKVYLYFYENGNIVKVDNKNYYEQGVLEGTTATTTEEANQSAATNLGQKWETATFELPKGLAAGTEYHVYALINRPTDDDIDVSTETKLLDSNLKFGTGDITATGNLPMAARSQSGKVFEILKANSGNTQTQPYRLDFEVERSYARIAFIDKTFTVPLKASTATDAATLGTVELAAYKVINKSEEFYTYRHVGDISSAFKATPVSGTNTISTNYGDISCPKFVGPVTDEENCKFVIEPNSEKKTASALFDGFINPLSGTKSPKSTSPDDLKAAGFTSLQVATDDGPQSVEYVPENTMYTSGQRKGNTTGIIFMAKLKPSKENVVDADGHWGEGQDLYYQNGKFYASLSDFKIEGLSKANMSTYGIRYYKGGIGYYEYYIRHNNNNNDSVMGVMEFAIVRNNSYELHVQTIAMSPYNGLPGDEDPDPNDPDVDPNPDKPNIDDPDEGAKVYMQVDVVVRPWVLRTNDMVLGH